MLHAQLILNQLNADLAGRLLPVRTMDTDPTSVGLPAGYSMEDSAAEWEDLWEEFKDEFEHPDELLRLMKGVRYPDESLDQAALQEEIGDEAGQCFVLVCADGSYIGLAQEFMSDFFDGCGFGRTAKEAMAAAAQSAGIGDES